MEYNLDNTTKKIVQFPLEIVNGRVKLSSDPAAELDLMLEYLPNRRTLNPDYGIDIQFLMQTTIQQIRLASIALLEIRTKFLKYITLTKLVNARLFKKQGIPRVYFLEISFVINEEIGTKEKDLNII
jgi:hypothetical protein